MSRRLLQPLNIIVVDDPPCQIPSGSPVPEPATTINPSTAVGTPYFCQEPFSLQEGAMTCPNNAAQCIPMSYFCNGRDDCSDGSDEVLEVCRQVGESVVSLKQASHIYVNK